MPMVFTSILDDFSAMDWLGEVIYSISQTPQVLLDCQVYERNRALALNWDAICYSNKHLTVENRFH